MGLYRGPEEFRDGFYLGVIRQPETESHDHRLHGRVGNGRSRSTELRIVQNVHRTQNVRRPMYDVYLTRRA